MDGVAFPCHEQQGLTVAKEDGVVVSVCAVGDRGVERNVSSFVKDEAAAGQRAEACGETCGVEDGDAQARPAGVQLHPHRGARLPAGWG